MNTKSDLERVLRDGMALATATHQTPDILLAAVSRNDGALRYVKEQLQTLMPAMSTAPPAPCLPIALPASL